MENHFKSINAFERMDFDIPLWTSEKIMNTATRMQRAVSMSREYMSLDTISKVYNTLLIHYPRIYYTVLENKKNWNEHVLELIEFYIQRDYIKNIKPH